MTAKRACEFRSALGHFKEFSVLFFDFVFFFVCFLLLSPTAAAALSIALAFGVHLATLGYRSVSAYLRFVFIFRQCFLVCVLLLVCWCVLCWVVLCGVFSTQNISGWWPPFVRWCQSMPSICPLTRGSGTSSSIRRRRWSSSYTLSLWPLI